MVYTIELMSIKDVLDVNNLNYKCIKCKEKAKYKVLYYGVTENMNKLGYYYCEPCYKELLKKG